MPRVLAIQSHVVSGYVGNKCAVFPLQLLGIDVDPLNTVQVSNHSGYPVIRGLRMESDHFESIFNALELNGKDNYEFILSGYMGNPSSVPSIAQGIGNLLKKKTGLRYLMDPVLGDNGKLYLPKEMIDLYRTHLLPLAHILTPNQFEAELLADTRIACVADAAAAAARLGVPVVVVTTLDTPDVSDTERLALLAFDRASGHAWCIRYPRWPAAFTGTGDLFSALLVAGWLGGVHTIPALCTSAIWVMQQVLCATVAYSKTSGSDVEAPQSVAATLHCRELRLVQCKAAIERLYTVTPEEKSAAGIEVIDHGSRDVAL